jgi:hypothetical protein
LIEASIENRTTVTYLVTRPHVRGGTKTGLLVGSATLVANRFGSLLFRGFSSQAGAGPAGSAVRAAYPRVSRFE